MLWDLTLFLCDACLHGLVIGGVCAKDSFREIKKTHLKVGEKGEQKMTEKERKMYERQAVKMV